MSTVLEFRAEVASIDEARLAFQQIKHRFKVNPYLSANLFDANTILKADVDNTPLALTVPVQSIVGRITAGSIDALTDAEVHGILFGTSNPVDQDILLGNGKKLLANDANAEIGSVTQPVKQYYGYELDLNPVGTATQGIFAITPQNAIATQDAEWDGITINGAALDPSVADVDIHGIHVDFSGVALTNDPHIEGAWLEVPADVMGIGLHSLHTEGAGVYIFNDMTSLVAGATATGIDYIANVTGSTGGDGHAIDVALAGEGSATIAALGTHTGVEPIHQHIGTATPFDKIWEYDNDGPGWTDVTTGTVSVWDDKDDIVYFGHSTTFDEIVFIFSVGATKNLHFEFHYSIGGSSWTQFFPSDDTTGGQHSGTLRFLASDLSGWATDTVNAIASKYWIRITRIRTPGTGPTATSMKFIRGTSYTWDENGDVTIRNFVSAGLTYPTTDGPANEALGTDGAGTLIWRTHDELAGFVANEHIDWTSASVAFSTSSTGHFGGNLDTDGTLTVDTTSTLTGAVALNGGATLANTTDLLCAVAFGSDAGTIALPMGTVTAGTFQARRDSTYCITELTTNDAGATYPYLSLRRSLGTYGSEGAVTSAAVLGGINWYAHDGTAYRAGPWIFAQARENHDGTHRGSALRFYVVDNGDTAQSEYLRLDGNGETIDFFKSIAGAAATFTGLTVNGTIAANDHITLANTKDLLCATAGGSHLFSSGTRGGTAFLTTLDASGGINKVVDGGVGGVGPVFSVVGDDANVWHLAVQNATYSAANDQGLRLYVLNTGEARIYAPDDGATPGILAVYTDETLRARFPAAGGFDCLGVVGAVAGFVDNGVPGVDGTTLCGDTIAGGICTAIGTAFSPRRVCQAGIPAPAVGELLEWHDTDDGKTYLVYNDTTVGVRSVEMA